MPTLDLFGWEPPARYPDAPGHKGRDTGKEAAESVAAKTPRLQRQVLAAIEQRPMTPDEVAQTLGLSILTVRPRVSELAKQGKIVDTGGRRRNQSGRRAIVWRAAKKGEQEWTTK